MQVVCRQDDMDFRLKPEQYIEAHQKFIDRQLVETAVIQFTHDGRLPIYDSKLIDYMNTAPYWDIQLHGWEHAEYDKMTQTDIADHLQKSLDKSMELFGKTPTVWYPPWNRRNEDMETVAKAFGLEISNESYDIWRFLRETRSGEYAGTTFYYHLWKNDEYSLLDEALNVVAEKKYLDEIGGKK